MNSKLRNHVEILFAAAPKTARAVELKEELLANLNEKYDDLLRNGYDTATAFHIALSGIGDIDELFQECARQECAQPEVFKPKPEMVFVAQPLYPKPKPSRMPMLLGLCAGLVVGLLILAPGVVPFLILGDTIGFGVFCFFLCVAVAGGLSAFALTYAVTYVIVSLCTGQNRNAGQILVVLLLLFFLSPLLLFLFFGVAGAVHDGIRFPGQNPWRGINFFTGAIVPTGPVVIQERDLGDFTDINIIDVHSAVHVVFKPSDRDFVTIETHEDMMPFVNTIIHDGTLLIEQSSSVRYRNVKKLLVTVHSRNVPKHLFNVNGASRLTCDEPLQVENISLYAGGASTVRFTNIESTGSVNLKINGASTIEVAGKAESSLAQLSGASRLLASNFETNSCDASISGASRAEFGVISKELSVHAAGASHFSYKGNPAIKRQDVSGASRVSSN